MAKRTKEIPCQTLKKKKMPIKTITGRTSYTRQQIIKKIGENQQDHGKYSMTKI